MESRMTMFKNDPQLMSVATKFVNDVLEMAQEETLKRRRETNFAVSHTDTEHEVTTRKRGRWHSRARGFLLRTLSAICLCNSTGGKLS